jgi:hypothetical protein
MSLPDIRYLSPAEKGAAEVAAERRLLKALPWLSGAISDAVDRMWAAGEQPAMLVVSQRIWDAGFAWFPHASYGTICGTDCQCLRFFGDWPVGASDALGEWDIHLTDDDGENGFATQVRAPEEEGKV